MFENNECCVPVAGKEKETVGQMSQILTNVLIELADEVRVLRTLVKPDIPDNTNQSDNAVPDCLYANTKLNLQKAKRLLGEIHAINELM